MDERTNGLLAWQWQNYEAAHRDRTNLILHALTAPVFAAGLLALIASPWLGLRGALSGVVAMVVAVAVQGRGHRRERNAPAPFRGPLDVLTRLVAEQLVTFPRFALARLRRALT